MRHLSLLIFFTVGLLAADAALYPDIAHAQKRVDRLNQIQIDSQLNPLQEVPLSKLTATTERPLFSSSRRPPVTMPPKVIAKPTPRVRRAAKPVARAKPQNPFKLIGIIGASQNRVALLHNERSNAYINGKQGDELHGWKIVSVGRSNVVIENTGTNIKMVVFKRPS